MIPGLVSDAYGIGFISILIVFVQLVTKSHFLKHYFVEQKKIRTVDAQEEELMNMKSCLKNDEYSLKFIEEYKKHEKKPKKL